MMKFPGPFGSSTERSDLFDSWDRYEPENLPPIGPFLEDHLVLTDRNHVAFHRLTRSLFEERGVYDTTFGYNLAKLNLDRRHPDAGFRYARDIERDRVLRVEFTPTTAFCPQAHTLAIGAFRAWNGLANRHEYDLIRVQCSTMYHRSDQVNAMIADLEETFMETGSVTNSTAFEH